MLQGSRAPSSLSAAYFGDSRCRSIWQWQLVIAFTIVTISAAIAALVPTRLVDWHFTVGTLAIILITVCSLTVSWHRVGRHGVLALPVLDAIAIGVIAGGETQVATFLWALPVAWVASYYSTGYLIGVLSMIGVLRIFNLFTLGLSAESVINMVILLITLTFVGLVTAVGAERNRSARRLLRAQTERLAHALQRMNDQKARTSRLLDSLDTGIARVGPRGVLDTSNAAFHRIFALPATAQLHPTPAVEYRTRRGAAVPADETTIARAARGELFQGEVVWLFGLDGQWRAVRASTKKIDHGMVTGDGLLLIVEDVTESLDPRAGEDATRRTISHELRNPLTAILGHIDLLLERPDLDAGMRAQLDVVEHAGSRMEQLIDQALTSRPRLGDDDVDFDLAAVAAASVRAFAPAADGAGVVLRSSLEEPLPLRGDAFRVRQVVDNVVGNAIKYAQRGGRVSVEGSRPHAGEVALIISDTGIGIAAEDLPRIFEREFRTALARERGIPGTGLGLSISRDIIVAGGGRFEVTSEVGQGTQVRIVLPLLTPCDADETTPRHAEEERA